MSTSGLFIHASALINFQAATVSLTLTPSGGSAVTVFSNTTVTGLSPYESRVGFQAENSSTSFANFDLTNIDVEYSGARSPGTISFQSSSYAALENQGTAQINVVRTGGNAGTFTVGFVSADGTGPNPARNGVNYESVAGNLTFADGGPTTLTVNIPILDDHLHDGNKTVNLYISNYISTSPTFSAPLGSPLVATLTINNTDAPPPTVSSHVSSGLRASFPQGHGFSPSF